MKRVVGVVEVGEGALRARVFSGLLALVLMALPLGLSGCDKRVAEIKRSYRDFESAINASRGEEAATLLSQQTHDYYTRILELAKRGKKAEVQSLPPAEKWEVIRMRHRIRRQDLKAITSGREYIVLSVNKGWWADPEGGRSELGPIRVTGQNATSVILDDRGRQTHHKVDFHLEDGVWKYNWNRFDDYLNEEIPREAARARMDVNRYIMAIIEDETGEEVHPGIWEQPVFER